MKMGTTQSKDSSNTLYFNLLPSDLLCLLISYIDEARIILWLLSVKSIENTVYRCTRELRYKRHINDISDANFNVEEVLQFKSLQICEIPIVIDRLDDLIHLSAHHTLKEFSVAVPKEIITDDLDTYFTTVVQFFNRLIVNRGSILDMKIEMKQESESMRHNIALFFAPPLDTSFLFAISTFTVDELYEEMSAAKSSFETVYINGMLEIQSTYLHLRSYDSFLTLLAYSGNLNAVVFNNDITQTHVNILPIFFTLPNIRKVYISSIHTNVTRLAFMIFFLNDNTDTLEFNINIIVKNFPAELRHTGYKFAAEISKELAGQFQYTPRDHPVNFIYPLDSTMLQPFLGIPNLRSIGLYDDSKSYSDFVAYITPILQQVNKLYIFTSKDRGTYTNLKAQYGNRLIIKS